MSVKVLIDMNLSPEWVPVLQHHGWPAVHWSNVEAARRQLHREKKRWWQFWR